MKRSYLFTIIAFITIAMVGMYSLSHRQEDIVSPTRNTMIQAVYATGEVEPLYWAKLSPAIAGQVISVWVEENDVVVRDDILAQLDDTVEAAKLVEYQSRLAFLEQEKERYEILAKTNASSVRRLQEVQSDHAVVTAQTDAQAKYIQRMHITAPMDGVILKRDIEPGEMVDSQDEVFWIGQLSPLRITAEVDEEDIALVQNNQRVLIKADAFPDKTIEGTISDITPKGDPVNKDFRVRIALPHDTPLMIGMTVEVNIIIDVMEDALTIPVSSLANDTVWIKRGVKVTPHPVRTGMTSDDKVQIMDGLSESDEILLHAPVVP